MYILNIMLGQTLHLYSTTQRVVILAMQLEFLGMLLFLSKEYVMISDVN